MLGQCFARPVRMELAGEAKPTGMQRPGAPGWRHGTAYWAVVWYTVCMYAEMQEPPVGTRLRNLQGVLSVNAVMASCRQAR